MQYDRFSCPDRPCDEFSVVHASWPAYRDVMVRHPFVAVNVTDYPPFIQPVALEASSVVPFRRWRVVSCGTGIVVRESRTRESIRDGMMLDKASKVRPGRGSERISALAAP